MNIGGNGRRMMKGSRNREKERERDIKGERDREKAEIKKKKEQGSGEHLSIYNTQTQQQTFRRQRQGYEKSQAKEKGPPRHPPLKIVRDLHATGSCSLPTMSQSLVRTSWERTLLMSGEILAPFHFN